VIAYVGYWKIFDEGHITNVAVHPDWRGRKAATYLMQQMMQFAASEGLKDMTLEVRRSNMAAQGLYTKLGFKIEGERPNYYEDNGEDALIMWYRVKKEEEADNNDN
jgi:ribosomal-protein-alanine N-acetyltransferase